MKRTNLLFIIATITLMLLTCIPTSTSNTEITETDADTRVIASFDPRTYPLQIIYDSERNLVYIALYAYRYSGGQLYANQCGIVIVNVTKVILNESDFYTVKIPPIPPALTNGTGRFVALDEYGRIWIRISYENMYQGWANLTCYDLNTDTWHISKIPVKDNTAIYYKGYLWCVGTLEYNNYLLKVDVSGSEPVIVQKYYIPGGIYSIKGKDNYLWISVINKNKLYKFNIETGLIEKSATLNSPCGIDFKDGKVYVAESYLYTDYQPDNGTIAVLNETTCELLTRIETARLTVGGVREVLIDSAGVLWYTDQSDHVGMISLLMNKTFKAFGDACYYMTEVPGASVWFTSKGSAHLEAVESPIVALDVNIETANLGEVSLLGTYQYLKEEQTVVSIHVTKPENVYYYAIIDGKFATSNRTITLIMNDNHKIEIYFGGAVGTRRFYTNFK